MTRESKSRWRVIARERYVAGESAHIWYVIGNSFVESLKPLLTNAKPLLGSIALP